MTWTIRKFLLLTVMSGLVSFGVLPNFMGSVGDVFPALKWSASLYLMVYVIAGVMLSNSNDRGSLINLGITDIVFYLIYFYLISNATSFHHFTAASTFAMILPTLMVLFRTYLLRQLSNFIALRLPLIVSYLTQKISFGNAEIKNKLRIIDEGIPYNNISKFIRPSPIPGKLESFLKFYITVYFTLEVFFWLFWESCALYFGELVNGRLDETMLANGWPNLIQMYYSFGMYESLLLVTSLVIFISTELSKKISIQQAL